MCIRFFPKLYELWRLSYKETYEYCGLLTLRTVLKICEELAEKNYTQYYLKERKFTLKLYEYNVRSLDKWTRQCLLMLNYTFNLNNKLKN
jgi:hypothetical protein